MFLLNEKINNDIYIISLYLQYKMFLLNIYEKEIGQIEKKFTIQNVSIK